MLEVKVLLFLFKFIHVRMREVLIDSQFDFGKMRGYTVKGGGWPIFAKCRDHNRVISEDKNRKIGKPPLYN